jgi:hypothetical protein
VATVVLPVATVVLPVATVVLPVATVVLPVATVVAGWLNSLAVCNVAISPEAPEALGNPPRAQE